MLFRSDEEADVDAGLAVLVVDRCSEELDEVGRLANRVEDEINPLDDLRDRAFEVVDIVRGEAHLAVASADEALNKREFSILQSLAFSRIGIGEHDHLVAVCARGEIEDGHLLAVFTGVFYGEVANDATEAKEIGRAHV